MPMPPPRYTSGEARRTATPLLSSGARAVSSISASRGWPTCDSTAISPSSAAPTTGGKARLAAAHAIKDQRGRMLLCMD
ncbi:hypothetical protein D3C80_1577560 [compost metagenome]